MGPGRRHNNHRANGYDHHADHEALATMFPAIMAMAGQEGTGAVFHIMRPEDDTDNTVSFSAEALHQLHSDVMVFVVSRVMRAWDSSGRAPKSLTVDVRVRVT
jgi:hypothetical protein